MKLIDQVEYILKTQPKTRNSDVQLTFAIIYTYARKEMICINDKWYISTQALKDFREDNIKRIRCRFQNDLFLYPPTDPEVIKQRKQQEIVWRETLGYEH